MSPVSRKALIIGAVVVLLVAAYYLSNVHGRRKYVDTSGRIVALSDTSLTDPKTPGHPHIWIMGADGSGAQMLTRGSETDEDPSFSPDGSIITFISDRKGSPEVWIMNGDGTDPDQLTIGNDAKSMPKFSPDGKQIAFISRGTLTVVNVETHAQEILYPVPHQGASDTDASAPGRAPVINFAWAPVGDQNGTLIACVQDSDSGNQTLTLLGGSLAEPTPVASATNVSFTWAPDASHLLVSLLDVVGVRPPSETLSKLPPGMALAPVPNFPKSGIYTFGTDGSILAGTPPMAVMPKPDEGSQNPSISPDGAILAFETWPNPNADVIHYEGIRSILTANGAAGPITLNGPTAQPAFSADGQLFAFTAPNRGHRGWRDLIAIHFNNKNVLNLTTGHINVLEFSVSPAIKKS